MADRIEKLACGSLIQHGKASDRVYLMKLASAAPDTVARDLIVFGEKNGYSKIFAKVPMSRAEEFLSIGYECEARIPCFFKGREEALFLGFYLNRARAFESDAPKLDDIVELAKSKACDKNPALHSSRFPIRKCGADDAAEMAAIYKQVFEHYPFPIYEPDYLLETMKTHVDYFGVEEGGRLIALASAEKDSKSLNCEMTDFATLPEMLGNGLAVQLLIRMEQEVKALGFKTAYTIARSLSAAMNISFARCGYTYAGRLKNNTNISGGIESMNVWFNVL